VGGLAAAILAASVLLSPAFKGVGDEGVGFLVWGLGPTLVALLGITHALVRWQLPPLHAVDCCVAGLAAWGLLGAIWHPAPHIQLVLWTQVGGFVFVYLGARLLQGNTQLQWAVPLLGGVAMLNAVWAGYDAFVLGKPSGAQYIDRNNLAAFLNLSAALVAAWFVSRPEPVRRTGALAYAVPLICLVLLVGSLSTASRAGFGSMVVAILVIAFALSWTETVRARRDVLAAAAALLAGAVAVVILSSALSPGSDTVLGRALLYGMSVQGQLTGRLEIYAAAWRLFLDAPWHGYGLGMFWLRYPAYRLPSDDTTGFHVHNDYLELAIDGGYPVVVMLIALTASAALVFARAVASPPSPRRTAAVVVFGGLLAVATHSMLNFNLYAPPIPWVFGFALAQALSLASGSAAPATPYKSRSSRMMLYGAVSVIVLVMGYSIAASVGGNYNQAARLAYQQGRIEEAIAALHYAQKWSPLDDQPFITEADLLVKLLVVEPGVRDSERVAAARAALDRADAVNPWRPYSRMLRGHLFRLDPGLAAQSRDAPAEAQYLRALALDPYLHEARQALVRLLLDSGRNLQGARLALEGVQRYRPPLEPTREYLVLAAYGYARDGQMPEAIKIAQKVEEMPNGKGFAAQLWQQHGLK
jgi:O-antigen ligase